MTQITDKEVYEELGIPYDRTPFGEFFREGVLRVKEVEGANKHLPARPFYILDIHLDRNAPYVEVFKAKEELDENGKPVLDANGNWVAQKAFKEKEKSYTTIYSSKTELGRIARQMYNKNTKLHKVKVVDPPLYKEELVKGVNTFTKVIGLGFWEYSTKVEDGVVVPTEKTGVFIGLDSVKNWKPPEVRPQDVLKHIQEDEARAKQKSPFMQMRW